jgi:hypothetical protein
MEFERRDAPFVEPPPGVGSIMRHVLYALVPAAIAYVWYFGPGFVFNLAIAAAFCVAGEAFMTNLRGVSRVVDLDVIEKQSAHLARDVLGDVFLVAENTGQTDERAGERDQRLLVIGCVGGHRCRSSGCRDSTRTGQQSPIVAPQGHDRRVQRPLESLRGGVP